MVENYFSYQTQYAWILNGLLNSPRKKGSSRIGNIHSNFVEQVCVDLRMEFPLMEIKKIKFSNILHELLWFIKGDTNIKYLIENDCHIWTDDAFRYFKEKYAITEEQKNLTKEEFIKKVLTSNIGDYTNEVLTLSNYESINFYKYGNLDRVYGYQWRYFNGSTDQLQNCINTLKTNPDDRRMIVTAHNPSDIESKVVGLPSCHNYFQFYTEPINKDDKEMLKDMMFQDKPLYEEIPDRYLNIFVNIRSNDWFLGQPYNMASYAVLVMMIGKLVNMIPKEIVINAVDAHLYEAHFDASKKWLDRYNEIYNNNLMGFGEDSTLCKSKLFIDSSVRSINDFKPEHFKLVNYNAQSHIFAPLLT